LSPFVSVLQIIDADELRSEHDPWIAMCRTDVLDSSQKQSPERTVGALIELEGIIDRYFPQKDPNDETSLNNLLLVNLSGLEVFLDLPAA